MSPASRQAGTSPAAGTPAACRTGPQASPGRPRPPPPPRRSAPQNPPPPGRAPLPRSAPAPAPAWACGSPVPARRARTAYSPREISNRRGTGRLRGGTGVVPPGDGPLLRARYDGGFCHRARNNGSEPELASILPSVTSQDLIELALKDAECQGG